MFLMAVGVVRRRAMWKQSRERRGGLYLNAAAHAVMRLVAQARRCWRGISSRPLPPLEVLDSTSAAEVCVVAATNPPLPPDYCFAPWMIWTCLVLWVCWYSHFQVQVLALCCHLEVPINTMTLDTAQHHHSTLPPLHPHLVTPTDLEKAEKYQKRVGALHVV
ncbi:uncharacterized protein J3D65DRAFT_615651 [Phyllosticta citribraziliensis]|uniref:Uncharacterized protein n=1 Tax=Phyllosticta citribraziliensis TaxID=989973 RepID=A0ABR1LZB2_9PEZI